MSFTVFNYTNVADVLHNYSKPHVEEVGPYVYREVRVNEVVEMTDDNITYLENYLYYFDANASCDTCYEEDFVYSPSIVTMTLVNYIRDHVEAPSLKATLINGFLNRYHELKLFNELTVRQLIWGYKDPTLELIRKIEKFLKSIGVVLPPLVDDVVALQKNGTAGN